MALAHCILGKFLGVGCHCFPPPLDVPTFSTRCLHVQRRERPLAVEGGTLRGREMFRKISSRIRLPPNSRDLLHAANLRYGTDGFTSPSKKGVLRNFSPLKIRWLRPGLNPRTWVPKASTLPIEHRSRWISGEKAVRKPRLQHLKQVAWKTAADSYTAMERMTCNNSRWKAANQSKDWRIWRRHTIWRLPLHKHRLR
jgi:hypothetical protein